jgi:hypothetical protein
MVFDVIKFAETLDLNEEYSKKIDAFRNMFSASNYFRIRADVVREFLQEHTVADGRKYGIIVGGKIVEGEEHLIELLGDHDEITLEFWHAGWEPGDTDEDAYQWLNLFAERL